LEAARWALVCAGRLDQVAILGSLLDQSAASWQAKADEVRGRIFRLVWPMVERQEALASLRAMAHDANGEVGFPLSEAMVHDVVEEVIRRAVRRRAR
jgi:hypothetical protein